MPDRFPTAAQVKQANKFVYNAKSVEEYEQNESIFSTERQDQIRAALARVRTMTDGKMLLDVGCGTGNVARIAREVFPSVVGMDIGYRLLARARSKADDIDLVGGDGDHLPFASSTFDCLTMYAFLHHLVDHARLCEEAARVLKPGGVLYTDHDMNYYFVRLYFPLLRMFSWTKSSQFASRLEDIAEIRNTEIPGIDPIRLRATMISAGFDTVEIAYWTTANRTLPLTRRMAAALSRRLSRSCSPRLFSTHFSVTARKGR